MAAKQPDPSCLSTPLPSPPWEPERGLDIFFDCGTLGQNQLYPGNCALAESLDALGIDHTFQSFVGGHSDMFTVRFRVGIAHLDSVMWGKGPWYSGTQPRDAWLIERPHMAAITSPCAEPLGIRFGLPSDGDVRIDILDTSGRHVRRLVCGLMPAGSHSIRWRIDDHAGARVPAGVYFVRMQLARGPAARRRMVVIR